MAQPNSGTDSLPVDHGAEPNETPVSPQPPRVPSQPGNVIDNDAPEHRNRTDGAASTRERPVDTGQRQAQATDPPRPRIAPDAQSLFTTLVGPGTYDSLHYRVKRAYRVHTAQYWFVAVTSNTFLFAQILIAASITVLGAFNNHRARTATIFLGASNTVIAGLITYFKSRNQPNRARQFRNDLAKIVNRIDDLEANYRASPDPVMLQASVLEIRNAYAQARADAAANYPDLWVAARDVTGSAEHDIQSTTGTGSGTGQRPGPGPGQPPSSGTGSNQQSVISGSNSSGRTVPDAAHPRGV